ncbi:MAG TPA: hypothetical protein VH593_02755 [Ktedonobacteraceae bacterium]|jgi:hypothetical protein
MSSYDQAIAELVHQVDLIRLGLAAELGLEEPHHLLETDALLETPLAKDLQALALFAETGEGNPAAAQQLITLLLNRFFTAPAHPDGPEHIPQSFWFQPAGSLLARALVRIYQDDLISIQEAARLVFVRRAAICIALDRGELNTYIDPTAEQRRGRRLVRRSQVFAWRKQRAPAPLLSSALWDIYERRVPGGHQIVVTCNQVIVNQWVTHVGREVTREHESLVTLLEAQEHNPDAGHPEWVGQSASLLKDRYFRRICSQKEIQYYLQIHHSFNEWVHIRLIRP